MNKQIRLNVNGEDHEISVQPHDILNKVLREYLGLTGTKRGCDYGGCGACTVLLEGEPIYSCMMYAVRADGKKITTIEGVGDADKLHPVQEAFVKYNALQCGFCTPAMVLCAKALLDRNPEPTEEEVREALSGVMCRCTGYVKYVDAVLSLAKK